MSITGNGNITGHLVVDGVPFINGRRAIWDDAPYFKGTALAEALSGWKCPECGAHLSLSDLICLNACHFSAASFRRFQEALIRAHARVQARRHREERLSKLDPISALAEVSENGEPAGGFDDDEDIGPG